MRHRASTVRRLTIAGSLALALLTTGAVVGDPASEGWGSASGGWGSASGGCWTRCALPSAAGYAPLRGAAHRRVGFPRACRAGRPAWRPSGAAGVPGGASGAAGVPGGASSGAARGPGPVLGVIGYKPAVVARFDPRTLRPLPGPRLRLAYGVSSYGWSPDRARLVLGDVDDDVLHVIDPVRLRRLATIRFGIAAEAPQWLAWLGPRRVAVVAGNSADGSTLVMADPVAGRVLSRRRLAPAGILAAAVGDRLVLVHYPADQIAPVLVSVVDDQGRIRTVQLSRVRAGFQHPPDWDRPGAYGIARDAALAVDRAGGARSWSPPAGVAEVDLASLQATYRQLRQPASLLRRLAHWLVPPAEAKQVAGTRRSACWLGDGTLAVWGTDSSITGDTPATQRWHEHRSGIRLIDTRAWTIRPLDATPNMVSWRAGRLLAYGGTWDEQAQRERGAGLTLYAPGERPRHLLGTRMVDDAYLNGELVYASLGDGELPHQGHAVVSLRSGRVVASSDEPAVPAAGRPRHDLLRSGALLGRLGRRT